MNSITPPSTERFYGRRKGRALNTGRSAAINNLLPQVSILPASVINPASLLPNMQHYELEIGFGTGEHLAALAAANPTIGFIGAEPFVNGIAALLATMQHKNLNNLRLWPDDARPLLAALPPASINTAYVLYSDPWPKKRHAGRRFINPTNLERLARVLVPHGTLWLATDDPTLQAWYDEQLAAQNFFTIKQARVPRAALPVATTPTSRYEQKAIKAGRPCFYWELVKI